MSRRLLLLLVSFGMACASDDKADPETRLPVADEDTAADAIPDDSADSADTADSGAPDDTADTADTADTGETAPCTLGLAVSSDSVSIADGTTLHVGDAPSQAWNATASVTLHNPCDDDLRFLGHPDDWMTGAAFSLSSLPPVYLEPGDSAVIELAFTPGETGAYEGTFSLPYDQEGSPFTAQLTATATAPLTLVAAGEGRRVSTTHDYGETWSTDTWDTLVAHTNDLQRGLCHGDGTFVTVGGSDGSYWWTSSDGDTWSAHSAAGGAIGACAYGDGQFVAVAGDLLTSPDGVTWSVSAQPYQPDHLRGMAHGIDATGTHRWVAIGDNGRAAVTLDGVSWSADANSISDSVRTIAFGVGSAGPVWVAVGSGGTIATSPDGVSWTDQVVGSRAWSGVVWGGDRFLAGSGSTLYSSPDGYVWSLVGASSVVPLAHLGRMWFGADGGATLYRSDDNGLTWAILRDSDGGPAYMGAVLATEVSP